MKPTRCIFVSFAHHLDHLAPISFYEKIPLVVCNSLTEEAILEFYPWVPYHRLEDFEEIKEIDQIISASKNEARYKILHQALYQKTPFMIRFHHGFSDKVTDFSIYDQVLSYKDFPNHRLRFYHEFRGLMEKKAQPFLPKNEEEHPLLIALSWDSPQLQQNLDLLLTHPKKDQFIFRVHPGLAEFWWTHVELEERYGAKILSHDCPYIYPFLEHFQGILTDRSSIGYDALYFKKPLMVLVDGPLKRYSEASIDSWIEASLNRTKTIDYRSVYHDIFG